MTVVLIGTPDPDGPEPTWWELLLLEAERPVLEAELAVVEAECAYLTRPSELARARIRRAEHRLGRLAAALGLTMPEPLIDLDQPNETTTAPDARGDDENAIATGGSVDGSAVEGVA